MVGIYSVSVSSDDHDLLMATLVHNLDLDQMPFVMKLGFDTTACQVVLYDEQVMMLKLAIPTVSLVKLNYDKDENDIPLTNSK
jgi:hypothetical protein